MVYRTAPFSITFNYPYTPGFKFTLFFDAEYLRNGTRTSRYKQSFNGILIGTYTGPTQECPFDWSSVILSDFAKYSMTRSIARPHCDSWASCDNLGKQHQLAHFQKLYTYWTFVISSLYLLYLLLNSCDGNDAKQHVFLDRLSYDTIN